MIRKWKRSTHFNVSTHKYKLKYGRWLLSSLIGVRDDLFRCIFLARRCNWTRCGWSRASVFWSKFSWLNFGEAHWRTRMCRSGRWPLSRRRSILLMLTIRRLAMRFDVINLLLHPVQDGMATFSRWLLESIDEAWRRDVNDEYRTAATFCWSCSSSRLTFSVWCNAVGVLSAIVWSNYDVSKNFKEWLCQEPNNEHSFGFIILLRRK